MTEELLAAIDSGKKKDFMAFLGARVTLETAKVEIFLCNRWKFPKATETQNYTVIEKQIAERHNTKTAFSKYIIEVNNVGEHVADVLQFEYHLPCFRVNTANKVKNQAQTPNTMGKKQIIDWVKHKKAEGTYIIPDKSAGPEFAEFVRQLEQYSSKMTDAGNESYSAPSNDHDDYVAAFLTLNHYISQRLLRIRKSTYQTFNKSFNPTNEFETYGIVPRGKITGFAKIDRF